jgi:hypothetical protein
MASNNTFFAMALWGYNLALCRNRHAQPIGLSGEVGCAGSCIPPIFFVAHGVSVPISRGRPPALFGQA